MSIGTEYKYIEKEGNHKNGLNSTVWEIKLSETEYAWYNYGAIGRWDIYLYGRILDKVIIDSILESYSIMSSKKKATVRLSWFHVGMTSRVRNVWRRRDTGTAKAIAIHILAYLPRPLYYEISWNKAWQIVLNIFVWKM